MWCYYGISGTYAVLFFIHSWQLESFYHRSQKNVKKVDAEQVLMKPLLLPSPKSLPPSAARPRLVAARVNNIKEAR